MKKTICFLMMTAILMIGGSLTADAQFVRLTRHPDIPLEYDAAYVDLVKGFIGGTIKSAYGQYFGQVSPDHNVYGYGSFFTDHDGEIYGQFRNGNLIMGIRSGAAVVRVGTEDHYTAYDLLTGQAQYIFLNDAKYHLDAEHLESWRYMKLDYKNGDTYVGEVADGKRDGYGIYYYENGNYYFGRYKNGRPVGYGALFHTDNHITLQFWDENEESDVDAAGASATGAAPASTDSAAGEEKAVETERKTEVDAADGSAPKHTKRRGNPNAWSH